MREEIKGENGSEGEGSGFSQLGIWEGSGTEEKMTADKAQESSWAGDTKVPQLPRLEGHIICHWKDQFPRLATKALLLPLQLKPIPYTSERGKLHKWKQTVTMLSFPFE